jgi:hypothetical protein
MKNKLANTKSQLAKLMATENVTVQHQNVPTASFDVKNRVLTLPNLEDGLSVNLYDLMTSHEVGHALWTPEDGWHDAVCDKGQVFKGFINVVEDARIEKKIKAKYPGLQKSYREGYAELLQRDFFGIAGKDITEMAFIDRINLHFKLGTLVNLKFEGEEAEWVEKIENAETFEDVMAISNSLYDQQIEQAEEQLEEEVEQLMSGQGQEGEEENENEPTPSNGSNEEPEEPEDEDFSGSSFGDDEDDEEDYDDDDFDLDELEEPSTPEELIESQTDASFRANEGSLVQNNGREYEYLTLGNIKSDDFVVPFSKINDLYKGMLSQPSIDAEVSAKWAEWRSNNQKVVNYMVKEFEMRKKADEYKRASTAKSGELDMSKIFSYKYNDDLFKRVTTVTGGKNHGFSMLLDWSGSMAPNMAATIDQMLNLVMFCKKVKIPFEVYAFSDQYSEYDYNWSEMRQTEYRLKMKAKMDALKTQPLGTLVPSDRDIHLMTLFTSEMKLSEFNDACKGMMALRECLANGRYYRFDIPRALQLGGTPLDSALTIMPDILKKFRERTRVQVANLVVLTDGDSHSCDAVTQYEDSQEIVTTGVYCGYRKTTVIQDAVTKQQYKVKDRSVTNTLIEMIGDRLGVNTIGFFIMDNRPREIRGQAARYGVYDQDVVKSIRANKFLEVKSAGYQSYFLIPGGDDMLTADTGLNVDAGVSKARLKTAFMKNSKSKTANRVLLNRLMEVAA